MLGHVVSLKDGCLQSLLSVDSESERITPVWLLMLVVSDCGLEVVGTNLDLDERIHLSEESFGVDEDIGALRSDDQGACLEHFIIELSSSLNWIQNV